MFKKRYFIALTGLALWMAGCKVPAVVQRTENREVPAAFTETNGTGKSNKIPWKKYLPILTW